jgi:drug/metabolite transporter (DMT)-like permease
MASTAAGGQRFRLRLEYLLLTITALFWALGHPLGRIILREVHPFQLAAANLVVGFLSIFLYLLVSGQARGLLRLAGGDLAASLGLGVLGFFVYQICTFSALARIPASVNALLISSNVVIIVLLSVVVLKERISWQRILGILVALGGVVLVTFNTGLELGGRVNLQGCAFSIAAAVSFSLYTVFGKRLLARNDPLLVVTIALFSGALCLTALCAATVGFRSLFAASPRALELMLFLGITMIGIAYPLWFSCLKRLPAGNVSIFIYLSPIFAVILSMLILQERFAWPFWIGGALVLAGIVGANLVYAGDRRPT